MVALLGSGDELLRLVEAEVDADIHVRGNEIAVTGQPADNAFAVRVFDELIALLGTGQALRPDSVRRVIGMLRSGGSERPAEVLSLDIISRRGRTIRPKTLNQKRYVDAIDAHTIVFGIGPAGTGKTYLAMAKAVQALQTKQVNRIILTRPGGRGRRAARATCRARCSEKIDPYLRPLYDALHDMVDPESIPRLMAAGTIEVAPLAYMRGRAQPYRRAGADARGLPADRRHFGSATWSSARTALPTLVLGVYPQGKKDGLPRHHPGRRVDAGLRRAPVDGPHARMTGARQAGPRPADPGDDRQPARGARPPIRAAAASSAGASSSRRRCRSIRTRSACCSATAA